MFSTSHEVEKMSCEAAGECHGRSNQNTQQQAPTSNTPAAQGGEVKAARGDKEALLTYLFNLKIPFDS